MLGLRTFGGELGQVVTCLMNEFSVLVKRLQNGLASSAREDTVPLAHLWNSNGPSPENALVGNLIYGFKVFRTVRNKFLLSLSLPVYGILLQQPKQSKKFVILL